MKALLTIALVCLLLFGCIRIDYQGYNEPVQVEVQLPSPAEIVDASGQVVKDLTDSMHVKSDPAQPTAMAVAKSSDTQDVIYRVRNANCEAASQLGAYCVLQNAVAACPHGYCVFDSNDQLIYTPE